MAKLGINRRRYIDRLVPVRPAEDVEYTVTLTGAEQARRDRAEERTAWAKRGSYFRHQVLAELLAKGKAEQEAIERFRSMVVWKVEVVSSYLEWREAEHGG